MKTNWIEHKHEQMPYKGRFVHNWFSNMTLLSNTITFAGLEFNSVENAYQAAKCADKSDVSKFVDITPQASKRLGKAVKLRKDWDEVKIKIMAELIKQKFEKNADQFELLMSTGNSVIVEFNNWNDTFWGASVQTGDGQNNLGIILMNLRDAFRRRNN